MTETLFQFDRKNFQECQASYRGPRNQEYFLGDYTIEAGPTIEVRAERRTIGTVSIIRNVSRTNSSFRRTWSHIREDAADITLFWFVNRGHLRLSHHQGTEIAAEGDMMTLRSLTPFLMECRTDVNSLYDVYEVVVPTHKIRELLNGEIRTGYVLLAGRPEITLAEQIVSYLFAEGDKGNEDLSHNLVESTLSLICDAIKNSEAANPTRQSVSDVRLNDVLRFIDNHLSDSNLSVNMVADGCGISPRYTSHLLKSCGTQFSTLVWEKRLSLAAQLIATSHHSELFISEIAYRVGFKSPAHFSRMFKRVYKMSPREYRNRRVETDQPFEPEGLRH